MLLFLSFNAGGISMTSVGNDYITNKSSIFSSSSKLTILQLNLNRASLWGEGINFLSHQWSPLLKAIEYLFIVCRFYKKLLNEIDQEMLWCDWYYCTLLKELGDVPAKEYLYQRIYLAIQKGNATSVHGTLPNIVPMDEIYNL